jgi:mono/diheme cytochrome c family protein
MRNTLGMLALGALLLPAAPAAFGGWAVITVKDPPEYLRVGEATRLEFTIRQHGRTFMDDRSPNVTLRKAGGGWLSGKQRFAGVRADGPGAYVATVTPEDTGSVEITVDSDWGSSRVTLLPIPVLARGQEAPAPAADDLRGRQLFVAEGCVTCHVKNDDPVLASRNSLSVGPELTGRQFPLEWITQKLADPASLRVGTGQQAVMPDLGLSPREIAALASYVNGVKQQATR